MREILFKAKRIDNGEWVEGNLLQTTAVSLKSFIVTSSCYTFDKWDWTECVQVDTDTICQYTGLTDKNGNKIWENDVLEWKFENADSDYYECVWLENECAFAFKHGNDYTNPVDCYDDDYTDYFCMEVIGNIFENIAKKPIIWENRSKHCPNCEETIFYADSFCIGCGQKLDWSDN